MPATGIHLWLILWKAHDAVREHAVRDIARCCLGFKDFALLEVLLHKGPTPVNTIGNKIGLTSGSITAAVDRLEAKGLVERRDDPGDRRSRIVHLTEEGKRLISRAFAEHEEVMNAAVSGLNPEERDQAIALLKKLGKRAEELLATDPKQSSA